LSKSILVLVAVLISMAAACTKSTPPSSETVKSTTQPAQPRHSVDVVKANAKGATIKAGGDGDAIVQLTIESGYHVNANPPTFSYLKATELELQHSPGVAVSFIVYPNPLTKTFPFAEKPLAVYEGVTDIKAKLKVDKSTKPGQYDLPAKVQVQACDNQVCYAPGTLEITIPLVVK
jgi:thiol:disulfide interchange protein DsbD